MQILSSCQHDDPHPFYYPKWKWRRAPHVGQAERTEKGPHVRDKQEWHRLLAQGASPRNREPIWAKMSDSYHPWLVSAPFHTRGHLDNSTQWIISPSHLLREFCTFEGYVILEFKLNARLRWAHLACCRGLATGAEGRDAARAGPWEQMALKHIVQVRCMEIIHLDEQMKSADLLLQSFEGNEIFLCIRLEACDPKGHFALSVLSQQPVKDGWSEPSVRSGIQETPAGS